MNHVTAQYSYGCPACGAEVTSLRGCAYRPHSCEECAAKFVRGEAIKRHRQDEIFGNSRAFMNMIRQPMITKVAT